MATDCARAWPGRFLVAVEGSAAVVLLEEEAAADESGRAEFFEDRLEQVLRQRMPELPAQHRGQPPRACSLPDYGKAYAAARRGLDLVRLLGRSRQVVSFRHLGVQEILLQVEEPAALLEFIARYVEPLERYDEEHSSKLLVSLETFYDSGFNLQEAARRLDVHVSTLRYRLTRIEELLGVDPKVGDSRLNIEVAVQSGQGAGRPPGLSRRQLARPARSVGVPAGEFLRFADSRREMTPIRWPPHRGRLRWT